LLMFMFAPIAGLGLLAVWLIKKGYNIMNQNTERYCYVAYKHNQTGQVFDSGIQLESEIDVQENNIINAGHLIMIRYNDCDVNKLKGWIETFRKENSVIC
jgi:glutaminase